MPAIGDIPFCILSLQVYRFSLMDEINIPTSPYPRIVVIGGGFGGINFIKSMNDAPYQIVLLDQNNFHQFLPLLYQVATCGLEPDGIIFPLRKLFERQDNVCFRMTSVEAIDATRKVITTGAGTVCYDKLVIATGSVTNFFGNDELAKHSIGMKDIREALNIRSLVLENLEAAAISSDPEERDALTNFVVVGGGPAGVETVGALAEFKRYILKKDYPTIDTYVMKVYLVQSGDRLLKGMSKDAGLSAVEDLKKMDVEIVLNNRVQSYDGTTVTTDTGLELKSRVLVWTAGVQGALPDGIHANAITTGSRIKVNAFSQVQDMPDVFAIGDIAWMPTEDSPNGHPMVATTAIQQGAHLAKNLARHLAGQPMLPFLYFDKGSLATIGKRRAVADVGKHHLHGFSAWLIWCFVHIFYLIGFRNKLLVFTNWLMSYMSYEKGNRFIVRRSKEM